MIQIIQIIHSTVTSIQTLAYKFTSVIVGSLLLSVENIIYAFVPSVIVSVVYANAKKVYTTDRIVSTVKEALRDLLILFMLLVVADYLDVYIIKDTDTVTRLFLGGFFFAKLWNTFGLWSKSNKFAKIAQNIMKNKAEKTFDIDLDGLADSSTTKEENKDV